MLNGNVLKVSDQEKDLGVLTLGTLIRLALIKANMLISWIARSIINRGKDVMLPIYKTLIRPH